MLAGFFVAVGAAACYEVAYVLQALQARRESPQHGLRLALLGRLLRNPRWVGATALTAAGVGLQVWALSLAPLGVVQPTLALGLLALPILARVVLRERLRAREAAAVATIVAGVALVAAFGPEQAGREAAGWQIAVELAVLVGLLAMPFALRGRGLPPQLAVLGAASGDAVAALGMKLAADALQRGDVGAAVGWGALGAACGATALTAEMSALQRLRATRVAPVVVAFQVLVPVATGVAFLGESWSATPGGGVLLGAAIAAVVAGAAVLSATRSVEGMLGGASRGRG